MEELIREEAHLRCLVVVIVAKGFILSAELAQILSSCILRRLFCLYIFLLVLVGELVFHGIRSEQCILELPFLNLKNNLGLYPKKWARSYMGLKLTKGSEGFNIKLISVQLP